MKNIIFLLLAIVLTLTSCEYEPVARFEASNTIVSPYENIQFYNYSTHASEYEWNFGDGTTSYEFEPAIYYTQPGIYDVRLSAFNGNNVSDYYMTIEVANISIEVREYYKNYLVPDAKVVLYPTYNDWVNQTNEVASGITDNNGIVLFYVPNGFYYMDIWNSSHDNLDLAKTDLAYIKTPYLNGTSITNITALVDYYGTKSARADRKAASVTVNQRPYNAAMSLRAKK
jgi:hypothetical protein